MSGSFKAFWSGVGVAVLMALFPPQNGDSNVIYDFLFSPGWKGEDIIWPRFAVELIIPLVVMVGAVISLHHERYSRKEPVAEGRPVGAEAMGTQQPTA